MLVDNIFVSLVYILLMNKRLKFHFSHLDEGLGKWIFFQARYNAVFSSSNISDLTVTACMEALAFLMTPAHPHCPVAALLRRLPPPKHLDPDLREDKDRHYQSHYRAGHRQQQEGQHHNPGYLLHLHREAI